MLLSLPLLLVVVTGARISTTKRSHWTGLKSEAAATRSPFPEELSRPRRLRHLARVRFPYFDAVVVPSARGPESVSRAAVTAREAGARLVVLSSGKTVAQATTSVLQGMGWTAATCAIVDIGSDPPSWCSSLRTWNHSAAADPSDTSLKRNIGLMLARTMRWQSILFVDDDVQSMSRAQLRQTAGLLRGLDRGGHPRKAVGWAFGDFPDFSVVGHALRAGRGTGTPFIGGGALAVDCSRSVPFFPFIYNEDLLFLFSLLSADPEGVCLAGALAQDRYDAFGDTARAANQEFGDVLAYGLYQLFSEEVPFEIAAEPDYWESIVAYRKVLLSYSARRLRELGVTDGAECVRVAAARHRDDWSNLLADYFVSWHDDLRSWRTTVESQPKVTGIPEAIEAVGLSALSSPT
ncbi:hypothetical protein HNP84_000859 [Thermocatellispora tengchongensis]|uniref:Uncharacterized protein n=1 Tax=Thermocatellispora tengchongensis TaxID=1073253 RepID=A0A840NZM8_9ACTN|nr:hypothetical protein [Thermocatellispora tengchongensis]MBB5131153.1 hypothetical protein [Thermocatellispora tengchongensis]